MLCVLEAITFVDQHCFPIYPHERLVISTSYRHYVLFRIINGSALTQQSTNISRINIYLASVCASYFTAEHDCCKIELIWSYRVTYSCQYVVKLSTLCMKLYQHPTHHFHYTVNMIRHIATNLCCQICMRCRAITINCRSITINVLSSSCLLQVIKVYVAYQMLPQQQIWTNNIT